MMKRVLCLVLAIMLMGTAVLPLTGFAVTEDVSEDTKNIGLLTALNIYLPSNSDIYDAGYYVKRGYFAVLLKRLANSDKTYSEANLREILKFTDVNPSSEMAEGIAFCVENGYMNGVGDYCFEPDSRISTEQAIKPLLILLGRQKMAEEDGYPLGYLKIAKRIGLLDGISEDMSAVLNRTSAARLLYNALMSEYIEVYKITEESDGMYTYGKGNKKTYLRRVFDIELISGVVEGNENTMLDVNDKTADEGSIIIDGKNVKGENLQQYLGYYVDCYARVNDKSIYNENVYTVISPDKNKTMTINADDLASFKDGEYIYYNKDGKQREVRISADADVVFNGKAMPDYKEEYMVPKSGSVTLISNNNGLWNVVLVTYYNTAVVGYVDRKNEAVYFLDGAGSLDFGDADKKFYVELDGNTIPVNELAEWDVLSIAADVPDKTTDGCLNLNDSKVFNIKVNRQGTFTSSLTSTGKDTVMFGGATYEFSENLLRNMPELKIGTSYKRALDFEGKIAYFEEAYGGGSYAILTRIATEGAFEKTVLLRMYTSAGEWKNYETTQKIEIDGQRIEAANVEKMLNTAPYIAETTGEFAPCLVRYSLNNELRVSSIDTSVRGAEENDTTMSEPLLQTGAYDGGANNITWFINGVMLNTKNTTFFNVPTDKGVINPNAESAYSVGSKFITTNTYCRAASVSDDGFSGYKEAVYAFNIDEYKTTDVLLYAKEYVAGMQKSELDDLIVVDEVYKTIRNDGTNSYMISGYNIRKNPRDFNAYLSNDVVIEDNCIVGKLDNIRVSDIKKGDVLRIILTEQNGENEISAILREFSPSNEKSLNPDLYSDICISSKHGSNFNTRSNSASNSLQFGWVYSVNDTYITLTNVRDAKTVEPSNSKQLYGFYQDKNAKPFVLTYNKERNTITLTENYLSIPNWKSIGDTANMPVSLCYSTQNYLKMVMVIE